VFVGVPADALKETGSAARALPLLNTTSRHKALLMDGSFIIL